MPNKPGITVTSNNNKLIMMRTIPAIIRNMPIFGLGVALTSYNVKRGLEMIIVAFKVAFAS
jgi:hypothetical protein